MTSSAAARPKPALALSQRVYNTVSYAGAASVMILLADWKQEGVPQVAGLWLLHFLRRTVESLWVHRFSGRSVPPSDYLVEYLYYWGFGTWIALGISASNHEPASTPVYFSGLALFAVGQVGNTWAHQKLRALRSASGVTQKSLPEGGLFDWIACPHYLFEILTWAGFALLALTWGALAFFVVGAVILASYAHARHQTYRKEFDGQEGRPLYSKNRRALLPFVF